MKTLSIKIPEPLAQWLTEESERRRRSRSAIVREALEKRRDGSHRAKMTSMAEALRDLKGSLRGPRDLSTNPNHFDGFGQ
jgi:Arc/MetJ-type ribon-helix-helix transcriptional regulator